MCLYPRLIKNKKYTANNKNKGIVPEYKDKRVLAVPVGCGNCIYCRKQKSTNWKVRLNEEIRENNNGKFVTLTFNEESLKKLKLKTNNKLNEYDKNNKIAKIAVRYFLERWRKKFKKSVRHWLVTELGGENGRIHLHGIIWTNENKETINNIWNYGFTWIGDKNNGGFVNEQTVNYIIKYITKIDEKNKSYKPIVLCSHGIGSGYIKRADSNKNKYNKYKTYEKYKTRKGQELGLPIYYRNKIYSDEEREKLWIEKLDKNIRWIGGEKIDISKGYDEYYKTLNYYREINKELGYGSNIDWKQEDYEKELSKVKKEHFSQ